MNLQHLGWNNFFEAAFRTYAQSNQLVGRVSAEHRNLYEVLTPLGTLSASVAGKFQHRAQTASDFPSVGDWVLITKHEGEHKATIHTVLPRKTRFSRNVAGTVDTEQIIAANIDVAFIASSVNKDFNLRRLERYLAMAWDGGATPIIVLTKADLCTNIEEYKKAVESIAWGIPIHAISALHKEGIDALLSYVGEGVTGAVLGSSGVGKSTLINALAGNDILKVRAIGHYKDKGQHTTTHRQMIVLPNNGILIDTPGMRELQLWHGEHGVHHVFESIEELLGTLQKQCRFPNCGHTTEPGCAIQNALREGVIERERYASYQKLQREISWQQRRQHRQEKLAERKHSKKPYNRTEEKTRYKDNW